MASWKVADEVESGFVVDGGRGDSGSFLMCSRRFRGGWVIMDGTICTVMMV